MQKSNIQQINPWLVAESLTFTPHSQFPVKNLLFGAKVIAADATSPRAPRVVEK